jgi:hypothetical protein
MPTVRQKDVPPEVWAKLTAAAGAPAAAKPVRKKLPPEVRTGGAAGWSVTLVLPCRVISDPNRRDHWTVKRRRSKHQEDALRLACARAGWLRVVVWDWRPPTPCVVTFTHVGPEMDGDNLQSSFKALRDAVARWALVDDGDPRIVWRYEQRPGQAGVEIRIEGKA